MSSKIDLVSTVLIATCAVVLTGLYTVDRFGGAPQRGAPAVARLEKVDEELLKAMDSVSLGTHQRSSAVVLTEFIDVECPFCAMFAERLDSAKAILGDTFQIRFANFPLTSHRFARSGAAAVECAFKFGRGHEFVKRTYAMQDSLGFWPWERYAAAAMIPDTIEFRRCRTSPETEANLVRALALTERLDLRGTPTLFLDGQRYDRPPTLDRLIGDVRALSRKNR
jgi:protein-disulfide isomerase